MTMTVDPTAVPAPGEAAPEAAPAGAPGSAPAGAPEAATVPPAAQHAPATQPAPAAKKLYRSRSDRKIAGICGGLAEYFGADPTLVRVLFVLSILLPGPQVLAYLILWVIIPERPAV